MIHISFQLSRLLSIELELNTYSLFLGLSTQSIYISLSRPRWACYNNPGELYWFGQSLYYSWVSTRAPTLLAQEVPTCP